MTPAEHARAQPQGRKRAKPGTTGEGNWYRIVVRPKEGFATFRFHDVGEKDGDLQRLAGKRPSGSWATHAWLMSKKSAHKQGKRLVADTKDARALLKTLGSEPRYVKGDIFEAKDRLNVPEKAKPTKAQKTAQMRNIKKAQNARTIRKRVAKKQAKTVRSS